MRKILKREDGLISRLTSFVKEVIAEPEQRTLYTRVGKKEEEPPSASTSDSLNQWAHLTVWQLLESGVSSSVHPNFYSTQKLEEETPPFLVLLKNEEGIIHALLWEQVQHVKPQDFDFLPCTIALNEEVDGFRWLMTLYLPRTTATSRQVKREFKASDSPLDTMGEILLWLESHCIPQQKTQL